MAEDLFYVHINLAGNELRAVRMERLTSDPTGYEGRYYFNTADRQLRFHNGMRWVSVGEESVPASRRIIGGAGVDTTGGGYLTQDVVVDLATGVGVRVVNDLLEVDRDLTDAWYSPAGHGHGVSADEGNVAVLGSDELVYVPQSSGGSSEPEIYLSTVDPGTREYDIIWADPEQVLPSRPGGGDPSPGHSETIGDGSSHTYTVTHNFGTRDVLVQMYDMASGEDVTAIMTRSSNTVELEFAGVLSPLSVRVLVKEV